MYDFTLPLDALVRQVDIRLRRVTSDNIPISDVTESVREFLRSMRKPMASDIQYEVTKMAVPERDSNVCHLHCFNHFVSKQTTIFSGAKQAQARIWKTPPPAPTRETRARSAASPVPSSPRLTKSGKKKEVWIVVSRLLDIFHCPKTLTEGEIEKGEIELKDLLYTEHPRQPQPIDRTLTDTLTEVQPENEKVLTVCIDYYIDKFGVFRTTHRSVGGIYMTLHNLDHRGRDQPRNHYVLGFTPNGASTQESSIPLVEEMRSLAKDGFRLDLPQPQGPTRVYVKLLSVSADMAEANALAGCKAAGALVPCRFCEMKRALFNLDSLFISRADQQVD